MSERLPADIGEIAAAQVERLAAVVAGLSDADLAAPTRCAGWLAAHLLVHIRSGLVEHAMSFAEPAGPADVIDRDYVSYWRDFPATAEPVPYERVRYYWASASVYANADSMRQHFADIARGAAGMSRQAGLSRAGGAGVFRLQGHVMAAADILAMWTAEWVIHQLDLTAYLPDARLGPTEESLALTARTLDELTGSPLRPPTWDHATYALKGTGRLPLDPAEREFLGERAAAFPAFG